MTTATLERNGGGVIADILTVAKRNVLKTLRTPQIVVFLLIQPIMFVLLFAFVFGGAIAVPGVEYIDFLMGGIIAQTVAFASTGTSIGMAEDMSEGIMDRFRSLPMSRAAVLGGRTAADVLRATFTVVIMVVVGMLIGFRFHGGFVAGLGAIALAVLFGYAMSWVAAFIGLSVTSPEAAQGAGFIWLFPMTFASSAFVPVESMPGWLQTFAEINPITKIANSVRGLALGDDLAGLMGIDTGTDVLWTLGWIALIIGVFGTLSVNKFRRLG